MRELIRRTVPAAVAMGAAVLLTLSSSAAEAKAKPKPYRLSTCIVSGEKLGEMGTPYVFTHQDREIKLCCKSCLKTFNKEPAKYIKKLEQAEKTKPGNPRASDPQPHKH